jgi:hypothetical protein
LEKEVASLFASAHEFDTPPRQLTGAALARSNEDAKITGDEAADSTGTDVAADEAADIIESITACDAQFDSSNAQFDSFVTGLQSASLTFGDNVTTAGIDGGGGVDASQADFTAADSVGDYNTADNFVHRRSSMPSSSTFTTTTHADAATTFTPTYFTPTYVDATTTETTAQTTTTTNKTTTPNAMHANAALRRAAQPSRHATQTRLWQEAVEEKTRDEMHGYTFTALLPPATCLEARLDDMEAVAEQRRHHNLVMATVDAVANAPHLFAYSNDVAKRNA